MPISQDLRPISQDLQRDSAQEGPGESDNGDPIMGLFFVGSCKSSYDLVSVKETGSRNRIRCVDSENKCTLLATMATPWLTGTGAVGHMRIR